MRSPRGSARRRRSARRRPNSNRRRRWFPNRRCFSSEASTIEEVVARQRLGPLSEMPTYRSQSSAERCRPVQ
jgi:hypothetical protein